MPAEVRPEVLAAEPAEDHVTYTVNGAVATVTLSHPDAMNSLDTVSKVALLSALTRAADDESVRCVVVTGSGRAFCVGQDLREHAELLESQGADRVWSTVDAHYSPIALAIMAMDKPVVAGVNGVAAGAGMSIALACDLRVAADTARFTTAFTQIGLSCDTGSSWTLPRLVGRAKALELLLLPRAIGAAEALELGLVTQVVPAADLVGEVEALAAQLAKGPTHAYAAVKRSLRFAASHTLEESLGFESEMMLRTGASDDHQNAVRSFLTKQQPIFEGQ